MDTIKWSEPREAVETIGKFGVEERGQPMELDGESADILCDGVAELLAENVKLRADNKRHVLQYVDLEVELAETMDKLVREETKSAELCTERDAARTEMLEKNSAAADALNYLWKEIVLSKYPNYGEWDYPNQAARFIKEEYDKLNVIKLLQWDNAPEWAEWLAVDSDWTKMWYENEPDDGDAFWERAGDGYQQYVDNPNWRNSLERRPEETENALSD